MISQEQITEIRQRIAQSNQRDENGMASGGYLFGPETVSELLASLEETKRVLHFYYSSQAWGHVHSHGPEHCQRCVAAAEVRRILGITTSDTVNA